MLVTCKVSLTGGGFGNHEAWDRAVLLGAVRRRRTMSVVSNKEILTKPSKERGGGRGGSAKNRGLGKGRFRGGKACKPQRNEVLLRYSSRRKNEAAIEEGGEQPCEKGILEDTRYLS